MARVRQHGTRGKLTKLVDNQAIRIQTTENAQEHAAQATAAQEEENWRFLQQLCKTVKRQRQSKLGTKRFTHSDIKNI